MHINVVSPRSMNAIFQRLKFAIQNGLLTQLVVSLPFIHVINTLNLIENIRDFFFLTGK
jgi:hypothetical protein